MRASWRAPASATRRCKALTDFAAVSPLHPAVQELLDDIRAGKPIAPVATTAEEGVAEALYGLGSAIGTDGGPELPVAYLQLALYLDPSLYLADMAIGDVMQAASRCDEAIIAYGRVPEDLALRRNADLQIAACLQDLEQAGQGGALRRARARRRPERPRGGGHARRHLPRDRQVRARPPTPTAAASRRSRSETADDWRIYYYRGVASERSKQWPQAEADFQHALKLSPGQASVLNYLGYSWVDMGINLDKALA